ncbi:MAG: hypothetical protein CM15mP75_7530 [Flammeovirgaceae bacterium]|nr:MAG: hypothetical protein CM15mP75_7530 [Flammeovirgaceae bacterium]
MSGDVITTGSNNVILGYAADPSANTLQTRLLLVRSTGQGDNYAVMVMPT